jgi:hypothetical protein
MRNVLVTDLIYRLTCVSSRHTGASAFRTSPTFCPIARTSVPTHQALRRIQQNNGIVDRNMKITRQTVGTTHIANEMIHIFKETIRIIEKTTRILNRTTTLIIGTDAILEKTAGILEKTIGILDETDDILERMIHIVVIMAHQMVQNGIISRMIGYESVRKEDRHLNLSSLQW